MISMASRTFQAPFLGLACSPSLLTSYSRFLSNKTWTFDDAAWAPRVPLNLEGGERKKSADVR